MKPDTAHTILFLSGLAITATGAGLAWGIGYSLLVVGGVLLAGVIYARTAVQ